MKKTTLLLAMLAVSQQAEAIGQNMPHPYDDITHVVGGAMAVGVVDPDTFIGTVALTTAIGVGKELTDQNFDNRDVATWVIGGVLYKYSPVRLRVRDGGIVLSTEWEF